MLVASGLLFAIAAPSQAGIFDPENSTLTFQLAALPKLTVNATGGPGGNPGVSTVVLTDDGSGGHILNDGAQVWSTTDFSPGTAFFTGVPLISDIRVTMTNNQGLFIESVPYINPVGPGTVGPGFGGVEPINGQAVVSAASGIVMLPVPLTAIGGGLIGGTTMVSIAGNAITATGALFNTAWVTITDITTNVISLPGRGGATGAAFTLMPTPAEDSNTLSTMGGLVETAGGPPVVLNQVTLHGTNSLLSGSKAGQVTLVTPVRVNTGQISGKIPGAFYKKFVFVPEPGALVLLVAGAAGLVAVGRKRIK